MNRLSTIIKGICVVAISLTVVGCGPRLVKMNGTQMNQAQLVQLDQWHCGRVWDGSYLLNTETGEWADADTGKSKGNITDWCKFRAAMQQLNASLATFNAGLAQMNQSYQQPQRRKSLSERGMLFRPGELLR